MQRHDYITHRFIAAYEAALAALHLTDAQIDAALEEHHPRFTHKNTRIRRFLARHMRTADGQQPRPSLKEVASELKVSTVAVSNYTRGMNKEHP